MTAEVEVRLVATGGQGPTRKRPSPHSNALTALSFLAKFYEIELDPASTAHELGLMGGGDASDHLELVAARIGIELHRFFKQGETLLNAIRRPVLIRRNDGRYVVLFPRVESNTFEILDPEDREAVREPRRIDIEAICLDWSGEVLVVANARIGGEADAEFGVRWFVEALWRYRRPLSHVLVASFFIQLFALVTPLFFQIVVDKVLIHKAESTLVVVVLGLLTIGTFDAVLQYLRTYALAHTSNRVDVELGARLLRHLLKLPLSYFETRATGQTVARVRELENIRSFLTGQGVSSLLDVLFTMMLIVVLYLYSAPLSLVVVAAVPVSLILANIVRPALRERLKEKYNRGAASQQFLVESIVGIHTVKASAIEPLVEAQWGKRLTGYVESSFKAQMVASAGQGLIQYLSKTMTAVVLYIGAEQVMAGKMTVGALVAFNMIAVQVFAPILRLSQLWQDFQQVQVSVDRLGDIFRAAPEEERTVHRRLRRLSGSIVFDDVHFQYNASGPKVLNGVSLKIQAGEVVGIVGPSGSGKSTVTKLVQRLYAPDRGVITIDGVDLSHVRLSRLRSQLGVVLQENLLFNRTVRENISVAAPFMDLEAVMSVARLAGADEFISKLPRGYDFQILERGANLSGGQRQRIAIARALARNPRVLIFDEATSALDYESERIIQENMGEIVRGRTVIIIAHRLAAVRNCDRIVALVQGRVEEQGTHDELLRRSNGVYAKLWALQGAGAERAIA